jgi:ERCC4-type nuclease
MMETQIVEPAVKQVYEVESRDETYQIVYVDEEIVLLRRDGTSRESGKAHRIERRQSFEEQVEAGFFEHLPDSDLDLIGAEEQEWADVDYIGKKTAYKLHRNGYETKVDIQAADDDELLDVPGLGQKGLTNLREFVR